MMEGVSIITITNNPSELVSTASGVIESANHMQKLMKIEWEYIIVDASKGGNEFSWLRKEKNVVHIRTHKGGFSFQRNVGVSSSSFDVIVFIDDSMHIPQDWLVHLISHIESGEADAVQGAVFPLVEGGIWKKTLAIIQGILGFPAGGFKYLSMGRHHIISSFSTSNLALRKKLIEGVGFFDEDLIYGAEDSDISLRIKERFPNCRFIFCADAYVMTNPRSSLGEIRRWFVRRGRSFATLLRKREKLRLIKRELILPKIFPPISFVYLPAYVFNTYLILSEIIRSDGGDMIKKLIPDFTSLLPYVVISLPLVRFYMDFFFSFGFYLEIVDKHLRKDEKSSDTKVQNAKR